MLANLYPHLLDRIWERRNLSHQYGAQLVRYADDLVILCKGNIDAPMQILKMVLDKCDLRLDFIKSCLQLNSAAVFTGKKSLGYSTWVEKKPAVFQHLPALL